VGCSSDVVVQVIHDKKIEQAVVVVIEPSCGDRPRFSEVGNHTGDPRLLGYVGEGAVSIVVQELVVVDAGNVKIDEAIIVIVSDGHSHRIADALQAGLLRYIGEGAIAVVAEEAVGITGIALLKRWDGRAIGKENVQQALIVVVEESHSAGHGFKCVALRTDTILERELDLRLFDDVLELDPRCSRHSRIRGLFAGSGATRLGCLMGHRRWDRGGRWGLSSKAGGAPQ